MNDVLVSLFRYKAWANAEMHAALTQFDAQRYPDRYQAMLWILDHANTVDRIFKGHLTGSSEPSFKTSSSEKTPSLSQLRDIVSITDDWYIEYASHISPEDLKQRLHFMFTDGDNGAMSREEMLMHVITHAGYHRGSVGQILEDLGLDSPPDSLSKYLHRHEPGRRKAKA